tara:strand:+ start:25145 stop:25816 length:672 start_codon:yes stop_codon:yes gene_type:complete
MDKNVIGAKAIYLMEVLVADGNLLTREGIKSIIAKHYPDFSIVSAGDVDEMIEKLAYHQIKLVIFDPDSLDLNSNREFKQLKKLHAEGNFLAISENLNQDFVMSIVKQGVPSFVTKECSEEEIVEAVDATLDGNKFFCNKVLDQVIERNTPEEYSCDPTMLTNREIEIITLICSGLKTKQIAEQLILSVHTINTHRKNILAKLNLSSPAELVKYAYATSLVKA